MSAFVVEDETINKVVAWLGSDNLGSQQISAYTLREQGYDLTSRATAPVEKTLDRLARAMFHLNVRAVNQRYGAGEAAKFRPLDFKYASILPPTTIQALKALQCWSYQCCEGDVPESPLYKMFDQIEANICRHLVNGIPGYEEAPWG